MKIDSIYSFNAPIIKDLEELLTSTEKDPLTANDFDFRFWIGHSLGLYAYCFEVSMVEGKCRSQLVSFSLSEPEKEKVIKVQPIPLDQGNCLVLERLLEKQNIDHIYKTAVAGIGEHGADGAFIYFQYYTPYSLYMIPIDCYECLDDDVQKNQLILNIISTLNRIYDLGFTSYIEIP